MVSAVVVIDSYFFIFSDFSDAEMASYRLIYNPINTAVLTIFYFMVC